MSSLNLKMVAFSNSSCRQMGSTIPEQHLAHATVREMTPTLRGKQWTFALEVAWLCSSCKHFRIFQHIWSRTIQGRIFSVTERFCSVLGRNTDECKVTTDELLKRDGSTTHLEWLKLNDKLRRLSWAKLSHKHCCFSIFDRK